MENQEETLIPRLNSTKINKLIYSRLIQIKKEIEESEQKDTVSQVEEATKGRELILNNLCY